MVGQALVNNDKRRTKVRINKKIVLATLLATALSIMSVVPAFAAPATSKDITITATPTYLGIDIAQTTWTINGIDGDGLIHKNTTYYSNAAGASGDVTAPTNPVDIGECYFVIDNTSTVHTDITGNLPTFVGGDAMTNIDTGYANNDANAFGASTYITGAAWPAAVVILKSAASDPIKADLGETTDLEFGVAIKIKSGDFTSGSNMVGTLTVTVTEHV